MRGSEEVPSGAWDLWACPYYVPSIRPAPPFIVDVSMTSSCLLQLKLTTLLQLLPPRAYPDNLSTSLTTKFVHTSTNKIRCPVNAVVWTPEGRRVLTGSTSGEFTLWNGLTFNFETILQAHDTMYMFRRTQPLGPSKLLSKFHFVTNNLSQLCLT